MASKPSKAKAPRCFLCFGNIDLEGHNSDNQNGETGKGVDILKKLLSRSLDLPMEFMNDLLIPPSSSSGSSGGRKNQAVLCAACFNQVNVTRWLYGDLKDIKTRLVKEIGELFGKLETSRRFLIANPNLTEKVHQDVARQLNPASGRDGGERVKRIRDLLASKLGKDRTKFGYVCSKDHYKKRRSLLPPADQRIVKVEPLASEVGPTPNQSGSNGNNFFRPVADVQVAGPSRQTQQSQNIWTPTLQQGQNRNAPTQNSGGSRPTVGVGSNLIGQQNGTQQQNQDLRRNDMGMGNPIVTSVYSLSNGNGINSGGPSLTIPVTSTSTSTSMPVFVATASGSLALASSSSSSLLLQPAVAATVPAPDSGYPRVRVRQTARISTGCGGYLHMESLKRLHARQRKREQRAAREAAKAAAAAAKAAEVAARPTTARVRAMRLKSMVGGGRLSSAIQPIPSIPKLNVSKTMSAKSPAAPRPKPSLTLTPTRPRRPRRRPLGLRSSTQIGKRSAEIAGSGSGPGPSTSTGTVAVRKRTRVRRTKKQNPNNTVSGVKAKAKPGTSAAAARKLKNLKLKRNQRKLEATSSVKKQSQCPTCLKFISGGLSNLQIHQRLHSGARPFRCQKCDKAFTQSSSRNLHERKNCPMNKMNKKKPRTSSGVASTENQDKGVKPTAASTPTGGVDGKPKSGGSRGHLDKAAAAAASAPED